MHIKKFLDKLDNRFLAVCSVILFAVSMLPIWHLAFYARPSGDDYGYSTLTHAAWLDTGSLMEVAKAAAKTVQNFYNSWNGDWLTTYLFAWMPEVFAPYTYWIVPFLMTGMVIAAMYFFMHEFCVKVSGMEASVWLIFTSLLLLVSYQFIPSTAIGMYWYVGSVHYMLPHAAGLIGIACLSKYLRDCRKSGLALFFLSLCAFIVGGGSYFTSLLLLMVLFAAMVMFGIKRKKKVFLLIVPFLICAIGFVIQCKAPGNAVRGGEGFGMDLGVAAMTILESLRRSLICILEWMREKTFVFAVLLVIALLGWQAVDKAREKTGFRFGYPLLFILFMYACYSAMYAPEVYSKQYDTIETSLGPATIQYLTFLLTFTFAILYLEGWVSWKLSSRPGFRNFMEKKYRYAVLFPGILLAMVLAMANRGCLKDSVDMQCYEYIVSGQAEDFRAQIASQMEILLDDSVKEAYLVPINPEQGPLMHMPVTTDENAFTNWVVKEFYQKDRVVMVE